MLNRKLILLLCSSILILILVFYFTSSSSSTNYHHEIPKSTEETALTSSPLLQQQQVEDAIPTDFPSSVALSKLDRVLTFGLRTKFDENLLPSIDCGDQCFRLNGTIGKCPSASSSKTLPLRCGVYTSGKRSKCNRGTLRKCTVDHDSTANHNQMKNFEKEVVPFAENLLSKEKSDQVENEVTDFFQNSCERWSRPAKPKIWKTGALLREKYPNAIKRAGDCCLDDHDTSERKITTTSHHYEDGTSAKRSSLKSQLLNEENKINFDEIEEQYKISSSTSTPIVTTQSRYSRASWVSLRNVCMSCEVNPPDEKLAGIMNPKRKKFCQTHLWSLPVVHQNAKKKKSSSSNTLSDLAEDNIKRLSAKSRGGRHSIFLQREASFVYGGEISGASGKDKSTLKHIKGTTWYLPSFSVGNVGHQIHDGMLGFAGSLFAREFYSKSSSAESKIAKPWRVFIDEDFFESSSEFYSNVMSMVVLKNNESIKPFFVKNFPTTNSNRKYLCFDHLIVSGTDRTGTGSKFASKAQVSEIFREAAFWYLNKDTSEENNNNNDHASLNNNKKKTIVRIFVYGRSDLYRRKLDNFGALVHSLREFVSQYNSKNNEKNQKEEEKGMSSIQLEGPILVSTFYASPSAQISLASQMDIFVTAQGAHEQIVSLFGPPHLSIIEICPCQGTLTSFVGKYGMFLKQKNQRLRQMQICSPMINLVDEDVTEQDLMLCPHHFKNLNEMAAEEVERISAIKKKKVL